MDNILVTGGAGFIGSNFVKLLKQEQVNVVVLDLFTYAGVSPVQGVLNYRGDICDQETVEELVKRFSIGVIVNFAAETHVDRSITHPEEFLRTNFMGVYNLLEVCKRNGLYFHQVSTDEVYGSLQPNEPPFTEESPYNPKSPYSVSKASADHLVRAYGNTYDLAYTISNCSNNYGPNQLPEKLIPLTILRFLERKPMMLYGDGQQIRDWIYVEDHCDAIWRIIQRHKFGETYNISGDVAWTNLSIVSEIALIMNYEINPVIFVPDRLGHDRRYSLNSEKIKRELGWSPIYNIFGGLQKTVQWYLDNREWIYDVISQDAYKDWMVKYYGDAL